MSTPEVRVRKFHDSWVVQRKLVLLGHEVWTFVGGFETWPVAMAVAEVEAGPDVWPYGLEKECP